MRRVIAHVKLNELHTLEVKVPKWELAVLAMVHAEPIKTIGETRCNLRVPDVAEEYQRLRVKYGEDRETRIPKVQMVYQNEHALADAMAEDLQEQAAFDHEEAERAAQAPTDGTVAADGPTEAAEPPAARGARGRSRSSG